MDHDSCCWPIIIIWILDCIIPYFISSAKSNTNVIMVGSDLASSLSGILGCRRKAAVCIDWRLPATGVWDQVAVIIRKSRPRPPSIHRPHRRPRLFIPINNKSDSSTAQQQQPAAPPLALVVTLSVWLWECLWPPTRNTTLWAAWTAYPTVTVRSSHNRDAIWTEHCDSTIFKSI